MEVDPEETKGQVVEMEEECLPFMSLPSEVWISALFHALQIANRSSPTLSYSSVFSHCFKIWALAFPFRSMKG
jgi:hypothetical protein